MYTKYYAPGDWNAICWRCGFKFKASQLRREWEGFYVCDKCWEPRHPQDFVRGVQDIVTPPWTQRWPTDQFVAVCDSLGLQDVIDYAVVDCTTVGYVNWDIIAQFNTLNF